MIKHLLLWILVIAVTLLPFALYAQQDSIQQRIIFIGDTGELGQQQSSIISSAAGNILPGKTTGIYVGDNVYPTGMGLPGTKDEEYTKDILRAQYKPLR